MTKRALKRMVREGESSHADSRYDDAKIRRLPVSNGWSPLGNDDANRSIISAAVIHSDDQGVTWSEPRLITDVAKPANNRCLAWTRG